MRNYLFGIALALGLAAPLFAADAPAPTPFHANLTIIEACSCPMFCQCFFNNSPATHTGSMEGMSGMSGMSDMPMTYCKFNNAYKINSGKYGTVDLAGAKFWAVGDLGADFTQGAKWGRVIFDRADTPEQREAIGAIMKTLYPIPWGKMSMGEGDITWEAKDKEAHATLDGGKSAEVVLKQTMSSADGGPVVIKNLRYFGESHNDGFVLMPNEVEAWRGTGGEENYEFKGTNGFMITMDVNSTDTNAMAPATCNMSMGGK